MNELIKEAIKHFRKRIEEIESTQFGDDLEIDEHEFGMRSGLAEAMFYLKDLIGDESEEDL